MNPRSARNVALTKPTETEQGQWYYQRYITHFPTKGEFVTFDRSWYNRAGVEPVMGFCTPEQHKHFLKETPRFEKMIVSEGIRFFKFWLDISQEMQLKRFHDRRHSPLTNWKFSPMDIAGITRWDDYTKMRDQMIEETHSEHAPWIVVRSNDKRRARIETIRHVLRTLDYAGRDLDAIGKPDPEDHRRGLEAAAGIEYLAADQTRRSASAGAASSPEMGFFDFRKRDFAANLAAATPLRIATTRSPAGQLLASVEAGGGYNWRQPTMRLSPIA